MEPGFLNPLERQAILTNIIGYGNVVDPKIIFISFEPDAEYPWDFIAGLAEADEEIRSEFISTIDAALWRRRCGVITREIMEREERRWDRSLMDNQKNYEWLLMYACLGRFDELAAGEYSDAFIRAYRRNELSMHLFPLGYGWKKEISDFAASLFDIQPSESSFYASIFEYRKKYLARLLAQYWGREDSPVFYFFLPKEEKKKRYMINFIREVFDFSEAVDFHKPVNWNAQASVWIMASIDGYYIVDSEFFGEIGTRLQFIMNTMRKENPVLYYRLQNFYRSRFDAQPSDD